MTGLEKTTSIIKYNYFKPKHLAGEEHKVKTNIHRLSKADNVHHPGVAKLSKSSSSSIAEVNITKSACDRLCNGRQLIKRFEPCTSTNVNSRDKCVNNFVARSEYKPCNTDCDLRFKTINLIHILRKEVSNSYILFKRVLMYSVGCIVNNNGYCGQGLMNMKIECVRVDKKTLDRTIVDLKSCDSNEIQRANSTKRDVCYIPCYQFEWRPVEIEVT